MRAAKVWVSLRICAVSPEPPLLAHTSSESRGTFRQKARSLAPLNGWACAVKICHDGMLEDTNSLDAAHLQVAFEWLCWLLVHKSNFLPTQISVFLETNYPFNNLTGAQSHLKQCSETTVVFYIPFKETYYKITFFSLSVNNKWAGAQ